MSALLAGTAGGMLMASIFICAASFMLFSLVRKPTPAFERIFAWGRHRSRNDVDLADPRPVDESHRYCRGHGKT